MLKEINSAKKTLHSNKSQSALLGNKTKKVKAILDLVLSHHRKALRLINSAAEVVIENIRGISACGEGNGDTKT